jgi:hypothetical protein
MIVTAQRQSPHFISDASIAEALKSAALQTRSAGSNRCVASGCAVRAKSLAPALPARGE